MVLVKINTDKLNNRERKQKAILIAKEMEHIFNHSTFRNIFIKTIQKEIDNGNFKKGEKSYLRDTKNAQDLYKFFMNGSEVLNPEANKVIDIFVDDYYTLKGVIGYTYPSINTMFVNTRFFDKRSTKLCGSNITHEYTHKKGAKHSFKRNYYRQFSFSYLMNNIYEMSYELIYENKKQKDLEPDGASKIKTRRSLFDIVKDLLVFWR